MLAQESLLQLQTLSIISSTGVRDYEPGAFEIDDTVKIRRPQRREAIDVDPREGGETSEEAGWFSGDVSLEKLFKDGFPIYANDPRQSVAKYITEAGSQVADAIAKPNEAYLYSVLRAYRATTGNGILLGDHPFIGFTASINPSTGKFDKFDAETLLHTKTVLKTNDVPDTGNLYGILSTIAEGGFIGNATEMTNILSALVQGRGGGTDLYQNAIPRGQFVQRHGVNVAGSNSVTGQTAITSLDGASATSLAIASVAEDTTKFFYGDIQRATPIGALDLTLTVSGALNPAVAVGTIIRVGSISSNALPTGFGVILRVNNTVATAPILTVAVCEPEGRQLRAGEISTSTDKVTVPLIPSVNAVYHQEALLIANRQLMKPEDGSGATSYVATNSGGMAIQFYTGSFDIDRLRSKRAAYYLTGAKISDLRKGCFALSL